MKTKRKETVRATVKSRLEIGFPDRAQAWRDLPARFGKHDLVIAGHPVMEDWERDYMKLLASIAGSKAGKILEVGFGMGISAAFLQEHDFEEHIVIEANRDVYGRLLAFARSSRIKVTPILGLWQEATATIPSGSISAILFDTYPLSPDEIHRNHFPFFAEAYRLLKKGGILTYYSDEATDFSKPHLEALRAAGFRDIQKEVCHVEPPEGCAYWKAKTIIAPILFKDQP